MASGAEIDENQPEAGVKYQQIATVIESEGIQCKCGHAVRALHDGLAQRRQRAVTSDRLAADGEDYARW